MQNWADKEYLYCIYCGHRWILVSDRIITDKQHKEWVEKFWREHDETHKNT